METISVIVPVYNVAPYLARCVDSLLGQTYRDLEVVLVDDGSKDESRQIMEEYAKKDHRVRPVYQPRNLGVSAARNRGLDECTGDWVCFCDGDDWYVPDAMEKLLACAEREQADHILCRCQLVYDHRPPVPGSDTDGLYSGCDPRLLIAYGPLSSGKRLVRRQLYLDSGVRFPEGVPLYEELPVTPVLAKYAKRIGIVDEPLYCYYQRGNGTSASNSVKEGEQSFLTSLSALRERLGEGYEPELEYRAIYALLYGEILNLCKRGAKTARIKEKIAAYEAAYPHYHQNPYYARLGRAKKVFLWLERRRWIPCLRLLARIHAAIVG